jgi:putative membrane protein
LLVLLAACGTLTSPLSRPPARRTDRDDRTTLAVIARATAVDAELARLALARTKSDPVKELASMLVADDDVIVAATAELQPESAPTTLPALVPVENAAQQSRKRLEGLQGEDFDRAFVDGELAFVRALMPWLDPQALQDPKLRALATELRAAFQTHYDHAQIVLQRFSTR